MALRDHMERVFGLEQVIGREFTNLTMLPVVETRDNADEVENQMSALVRDRDDLIAIYNAGGGSRGLIAGLERIRIDVYLRDNIP